MAPSSPKVDMSDLINQMKSGINESSKRDLAKTMKETDSLLQVNAWIKLKPFFKKLTGGDGFPAGHITQVLGKPDSGKTTLAMEGLISAQNNDGLAILIDAEHKYSLERHALMGGNVKDMIIMQVNSLEEAWDSIFHTCNTLKAMRKKGFTGPAMLLWDSLVGSVPKSIMESDAGDSHMAVEAKINNKNVRKLRAIIREIDLAVVVVNHYYMTVPKSKYEQPQLVIKGGEEITFFSTLIIMTKQGAKIEREFKGETQKLGRVTRYDVQKGHFHGRTMVRDVYVVDTGILEDEEQLEAYRKTLRGAI